jgi:uncharacterized protein (DUF2461 family)
MADAATNFTGFGREAFTFLTELAANQDRAWFEPRKREALDALQPGEEPVRARKRVGAL